VGRQSEVPPPAICLNKNGQWNQLLAKVGVETGLPVLGTYKAPGRGGSSLVLGTVEKMTYFYGLTGSVLDLTLYDLAAEKESGVG
jgi:hypothetical protein